MCIFEAWMPIHPGCPMVLVTHKAICDQACARLVDVLASGAEAVEQVAHYRRAQAGGVG